MRCSFPSTWQAMNETLQVSISASAFLKLMWKLKLLRIAGRLCFNEVSLVQLLL